MPEDLRLTHGEQISPAWTYHYLDFARIEKDQFIVPGKIESVAGREFAALNMIQADLEFASATFKEARALGVPDSENVHSRALLFSGVVAYARPFKTGVREIKLNKEFFASLGKGFCSDLHDFLIDLRDKHVAHSVNEFERCEATTVMVGTADRKIWRVAGIGFTATNAIGLSGALVDQAIAQISNMLALISSTLDEKRKALFEVQKAQFAEDGKWRAAPIATFPSRKNAGKRR
jgi:hypothetical protein